MSPFEDLIHELSTMMNVVLHPDAHQSCLISFAQDGLNMQIDLDTDADKILIGTQLGRLNPGPYRENIFLQAMRYNGTSKGGHGTLAFSEKNDTLVLFQFLPIAHLNGEKLYHCLLMMRELAKIWKHALDSGDLPTVQAETAEGSRMFGLRP